MKIIASVRSAGTVHEVDVSTAGISRALPVPAKAAGGGSAVNGGEFLMLALATCYCNDIHREAARLGIRVEQVEVEAAADFEGAGIAAKNVRYRAKITSAEPAGRIEQLLKETDAVAEVHNTLRAANCVTLVPWDSGL